MFLVSVQLVQHHYHQRGYVFIMPLRQWFSTFSVPWPIFQPKLTSQPTLVNKIKFTSQNHSVLQKKKGLHLELPLANFPYFCPKIIVFSKKKRSSLGIAVNFPYFCPKIIVFSKKKKVFIWLTAQDARKMPKKWDGWQA